MASDSLVRREGSAYDPCCHGVPLLLKHRRSLLRPDKEADVSSVAMRESRIERRQCEKCRERKARFRYRGEVRADRDHTLCFECFRSERDRRRARLLRDGPWLVAMAIASADRRSQSMNSADAGCRAS